MPLTLEQLASEAMQLPADARAQLAERMVESLNSDADHEVQRAWVIEAAKRLDDLRAGRVRAIPGEEVLAEVRRLVGR